MSSARRFRKRRHDREDVRRKLNKEAVEAWRSLSPQEQLASLDGRLGKGVGATRQRARIQAKIDAAADTKASKAKNKKS